MPLEIASPAVNAPLYRILPVLDAAVPTAKYVAVSLPPVAAGKVTAAALETALAETVHAPEVRATATRAYDVYAHSFVV